MEEEPPGGCTAAGPSRPLPAVRCHALPSYSHRPYRGGRGRGCRENVGKTVLSRNGARRHNTRKTREKGGRGVEQNSKIDKELGHCTETHRENLRGPTVRTHRPPTSNYRGRKGQRRGRGPGGAAGGTGADLVALRAEQRCVGRRGHCGGRGMGHGGRRRRRGRRQGRGAVASYKQPRSIGSDSHRGPFCSRP